MSLKIFYEILARVTLSSPQKPEPGKKYDYQKYVTGAMDIVNNTFTDPLLSLLSVAAGVKIAPQYLSMCFKKVTGNTFIHYLINKRLSTALTLIEQGNISVTEIAYRCGFSSPYYFSSQFKKLNGVSPKHAILERRAKRLNR